MYKTDGSRRAVGYCKARPDKEISGWIEVLANRSVAVSHFHITVFPLVVQSPALCWEGLIIKQSSWQGNCPHGWVPKNSWDTGTMQCLLGHQWKTCRLLLTGGPCCLAKSRIMIIAPWCRGEVGGSPVPCWIVLGAGLASLWLPGSGSGWFLLDQRPWYFSSAGSAPFFAVAWRVQSSHHFPNQPGSWVMFPSFSPLPGQPLSYPQNGQSGLFSILYWLRSKLDVLFLQGLPFDF